MKGGWLSILQTQKKTYKATITVVGCERTKVHLGPRDSKKMGFKLSIKVEGKGVTMEIVVFGLTINVTFLYSDDGLVACATTHHYEHTSMARQNELLDSDYEAWGVGLCAPSALAAWIWRNRREIREAAECARMYR